MPNKYELNNMEIKVKLESSYLKKRKEKGITRKQEKVTKNLKYGWLKALPTTEGRKNKVKEIYQNDKQRKEKGKEKSNIRKKKSKNHGKSIDLLLPPNRNTRGRELEKNAQEKIIKETPVQEWIGKM